MKKIVEVYGALTFDNGMMAFLDGKEVRMSFGPTVSIDSFVQYTNACKISSLGDEDPMCGLSAEECHNLVVFLDGSEIILDTVDEAQEFYRQYATEFEL